VTLKISDDGQPVLVQIRCKVRKCRRLLSEYVSMPGIDDAAAGFGWVTIPLCQRHGDGAGQGNIQAWQERQRRAGKPADRVATDTRILFAALRPYIEKAQRRGKTEQFFI
jgi:hypothetical protein